EEAGISIIGGHTIEDNEPKYGMVVTGTIHPDKILKNKGARENEIIILTKKLGTGILSTGVKRGLCSESEKKSLYSNMRQLNKKSSEIIRRYNVSSCTDVTGFGLMGHLKEICTASGVSAEILNSALPILPGAEELSANGLIPGGTENNLNYLREYLEISQQIPQHRIYLGVDAQTSGGLLFTINENDADSVLEELQNSSIKATKIGRILESSDKVIYFR
ncbi:MAG: selenide, water dikinase SelD, partial [Bacteroidota bacterium]